MRKEYGFSARRLAALAAATALGTVCSQSAFAQDADGQAEEDGARETPIVVTGTRIEGIAPVGSAVITVGQEDAVKAGTGNTIDLLRKVPQVLNFGGSEGESGGATIQFTTNTSYANSVNLRGLGTAATLNLMNNHRMPAMGPNSDLFEPDAIPSLALQGIEIVADGASAIYGSDAVTGVINYITRKPFDGVEVSGRIGMAEDRLDWKAGVVASQEWGSGGILVAYEHIYREPLAAEDRPELYNADFTAFGGSGNPTFAQPGNVVGPGGVLYGIPSGMATGLSLSDLLSTPNTQNAWQDLQVLPEIESDSVTVQFEQELFPGVEIYGDGLYYRRDFSIAIGSLSDTLTVPNSNPYSPCNPANAPFDNSLGLDCAAGSLQVRYDFLNDLGPEVRSGYEAIINGTLGTRFELPMGWSGELFASWGRSENHALSNGSIVTSRLNALLAGPSGGVPAFNPFCDQAGCNAPAIAPFLAAPGSTNFVMDRFDLSGSLAGPLFDLPGGAVRVAVGGEHIIDDFISFNVNSTSGSEQLREARSPTREINAVFGEIYIPLFGPDNATSGLEELELSAAVRYEEYSDAGTTTNPKFGITWSPLPGLKIHGSYGTSFHAPVLSSNNPFAQAGLLSNAIVQTADLAGQGFLGTDPSYRSTWIIGGNGKLTPETAETWSLGFDWEPEFAPGLDVGVNYYNVSYTNKIDFPTYNAGATAAIVSDFFAPQVYRNPAFFTEGTQLNQSEWNALLDALLTGSEQPAGSPFDTVPRVVLGPAPSAGSTIALIDARRVNTGIVETDGLDLTAYYTWSDSFAEWTVGANGTYVFSFTQSVAPGAPVEERVNAFGGPLRFRARGEVSARIGNFTPALFVNFQNAYHIDRRYITAAAPDEYLDVDAYTTFDLSLTYRTEDGPGFAPLQGITFTLAAQNVLDQDPPLVLNNSGNGIYFDNNRISPLGRVVSLQVRKAF